MLVSLQQFKPEPLNVQMVCGGMVFVLRHRGMVLARQAVNLLYSPLSRQLCDGRIVTYYV